MKQFLNKIYSIVTGSVFIALKKDKYYIVKYFISDTGLKVLVNGSTWEYFDSYADQTAGYKNLNDAKNAYIAYKDWQEKQKLIFIEKLD